MSRRSKIIVAFVVLLVAVLVAVLLWWLYSRQAPMAPVVNTAVNGAPNDGRLPGTNTSTNTNSALDGGAEVPAPVPSGQAVVKRLAMSFGERFGSYSNEGDFTNITDLRSVMTPSLQVWADGYVEEQRAKASSAALFFGTTTRALNAVFTAFDEGVGKASVTVSTQRRETSSTDAAGRVYYQDLRVTLVKQGGAWYVDSVRWGTASNPE